MPPRLKEQFRDTVAGKASETFKITNPMALPRLEKIVIKEPHDCLRTSPEAMLGWLCRCMGRFRNPVYS